MDYLRCEPFAFDLASRQLFRENEPIELTSKEFELALYLFENREAVISRKKLLEAVWDTTADIHTRTVDAHVSRLRQKLQLDSTRWQICSIYKHGYSLRETTTLTTTDVPEKRLSETEYET